MFDTHVLDAATQRRAERLESERRILLERLIDCLISEGPCLGVAEAYVVGSLLDGKAWTDGSDVDVAISGGDPLEVMQVVERATARAVDVIDLTRHPEPEMLRRRGMKVLG